MTYSDDESIRILQYYEERSSKEKYHVELFKDKKCIMYAAMSMESQNSTVLKLSLKIIENFLSNEKTRSALISTFGVYEALESLAIRTRKCDETISKRASDITEILRNSAPPAYRTRSRTKRTDAAKRQHTVYLLHIEELNKKNKMNFERALLNLKGIISFIIDMDQKRCTLRLCPKLNIRDVISNVMKQCKLKPLIVTKNIRDGIETYCDVLEDSVEESYIEYQTEDESTPKKKAIAAAINLVKGGGNIFKSVAQFWNESFYW